MAELTFNIHYNESMWLCVVNNLFIRDMPRLSLEIVLTDIPIEGRERLLFKKLLRLEIT